MTLAAWRRWLAWAFLVAAAATVAALSPITLGLRPDPALSWALVATGALLVAAGLLVRRPLLWVGAAALWTAILGGLFTRVVPFGTPVGVVFGPPGLAAASILLVWVALLRPARWLLRGIVALGLVTLGVLALVWATAPAAARTATFGWLAADSAGTLYAADADSGFIWVFDDKGQRQGTLWPRQAAAGLRGPGILGVGVGSEVAAGASLGPNGLPDIGLVFCGLAVDGQDRLYVVDGGKRHVQAFDTRGFQVAQWPLPPDYAPAQGCVAADDDRVYVAAADGTIRVFSQTGEALATWHVEDVRGVSALGDGRLAVLRKNDVIVVAPPDGNFVERWELPAPTEGLDAPYAAILARRNGEVLVTDLNRAQVRRLAPRQGAEAPLGTPGDWPGHVAGAGGWPGELASPAGLTEDAAGRVYVSDILYRVIQRFTPDGRVDAVWSAPEDEAADLARVPTPAPRVPTPGAAARGWPDCAPAIGGAPPMPAGYAPGFPFPARFRMFKTAPVSGKAGQTMVVGYGAVGFDEAAGGLLQELQAAGFTLGLRDSEPGESETEFTGNGWSGKVWVRDYTACPGVTEWVVIAGPQGP
ncbi:MAG: hypothetical protein U0768_07955 [Anaerolineae bacterium]